MADNNSSDDASKTTRQALNEFFSDFKKNTMKLKSNAKSVNETVISEQAAELEGVRIAPIRPINDFFDTSRFSAPVLNDAGRVGNRLKHNLLYYQTNYFILALVIFFVIGAVDPRSMLIGPVSLGIAVGAFVTAASSRPQSRRLRYEYPWVCVIIILGGCYFLMYMFGQILVFLLGIFLPLLAIIVHAVIRTRNIKNKLNNKIEWLGLKRTPMGFVLDYLEQTTDMAS